MVRLPLVVSLVVLVVSVDGVCRAQNVPDEPKAESYSLTAAVGFMDRVSRDWTKSRQCFACHTNYAYLMAKPLTQDGAGDEVHREVRGELEKLVQERWEKSGPRWDAEVVMTAAVLAMNDAATTGKLQAVTRQALDRMWTVQRADGGFDWLKCGWPPMESDDDYGIAIAALAVGAAPEGYIDTPAAQTGLARLRSYLAQTPPPTLHHQAMLLWPEKYGVKLLTDEQRRATLERLISLQKPDGGWNSATLGDWKRADGTEQDSETSDGYATGFVLYVLNQVGSSSDTGTVSTKASSRDSSLPERSSPKVLSPEAVAIDIPALEASRAKGVAWLKANQRASGRWHARSLNKDSKHYLSHAATAFAIMALADQR